MAHLWRRSLLTRVLAGVLAFFFAGCGASQIDNAPDGTTIEFVPSDWEVAYPVIDCNAPVMGNYRTFIVIARGSEGAPMNDIPVLITSYNPIFPLIASDGTVLTPDFFGITTLARRTDSNGLLTVRVAFLNCDTQDVITATSGAVFASADVKVSDASASANQTPNAVGTATPTSGPAPLVVDFDGSGSNDPDGTIQSYLWDFDDGGATATTATAQHTFNTAGPYNVTLTVTDNGGASDQVTIPITVN